MDTNIVLPGGLLTRFFPLLLIAAGIDRLGSRRHGVPGVIDRQLECGRELGILDEMSELGRRCLSGRAPQPVCRRRGGADREKRRAGVAVTCKPPLGHLTASADVGFRDFRSGLSLLNDLDPTSRVLT